MNLSIIIALIVSGILLFFAELLLPGGVIGALGCVALLAGLAGIFYTYSLMAACLVTGAVILFMLLFFYCWFKYFPRTDTGKRLLAATDAKEWRSFDPEYGQLLNKSGIAQTILRPSGMALIEGKKYDVVTQGELLPAQTPIVVINIEGNRIVVEKKED